jgi:hypothetical protein
MDGNAMGYGVLSWTEVLSRLRNTNLQKIFRKSSENPDVCGPTK